MRLITLNTWGGRAGKEKQLAFFDKNNYVDIFCLQEVWSAPYEHLEGSLAGGRAIENEGIMVFGMQEISKTLLDYERFFRPHHMDNYGLMMIIKKSLSIEEEGEVFVYKYKGYKAPEGGDIGDHGRNIQYVKISLGNRYVTVINFHGLWNGKGKTDSEDRILQSQNILDFINNLDGEVVLCGDFNLLPDTESLKMFEKAGLRNLIKEYGITSTRTSFYTKPEKYADYIFVSSGIKVKDFKVLPDEVSDHSALFLDFE